MNRAEQILALLREQPRAARELAAKTDGNLRATTVCICTTLADKVKPVGSVTLTGARKRTVAVWGLRTGAGSES